MIREYPELDAVALAELIRNKAVSSKEVLDSSLHAVEKLNPLVNAVITPSYESAEQQVAEKLEGPLAGVPFLIKDLGFVRDVPCSYGSYYWGDFTPDHDSELVRRYRQAGLVFVGKSNTPEVGLAPTTESARWGAARNPWNLAHTPGGSSGGAAAAVAAGIVPVANASDGGGSIRGPAFCCGLVGLKPTRARITYGPDVGEGQAGLACEHVVSRTVRDSALLLDVSHGPAPGDPYHPPAFSGSYLGEMQGDPRPLRVALDLVPMSGQPVHIDCLEAVMNTAKVLESLGHRVEEASHGIDTERFKVTNDRAVVANVANMVGGAAGYLGRDPQPGELEAHTLRCMEQGRQVSAEAYIRAISFAHKSGRRFAEFMSEYDVVLSPVHLHPAPQIGYLDTNAEDGVEYRRRVDAFCGFTALYNMTGCPAISVPVHWNESGLPVGVQLGAVQGEELLLLQLARQLEEACPWKGRKPPVQENLFG